MLLYVPGPSGQIGEPVRGTTRIEKMAFLFRDYDGLEPFFAKFDFEPNHFGPYSEKVVEDLEALRSLNLVEIREVQFDGDFAGDELLVGSDGTAVATARQRVLREFRITPLGRTIAEVLLADADPKQADAIRELKRRFNGVPLDALVGFVYRNSEKKYLVKSKIRDRYDV